ncbi:hypothetical protein BDZ45DRAFT_748094 [Acephala macrosclerotiorum]|nr:hypothetical protein BDZ45DRAFT_748094 [Acephala macrosclerotiorum]
MALSATINHIVFAIGSNAKVKHGDTPSMKTPPTLPVMISTTTKHSTFRGFSSRGSEIHATKARLRSNTRPVSSVNPRPVGLVVNRRLTENNHRAFLLEAFFDNEGLDAGYPPLELARPDSWERCQLHQAASSQRLYHETTITNLMVLGSGRNRLGRQC